MSSKSIVLVLSLVCVMIAPAADKANIAEIRLARKKFDASLYKRTGGEIRKPGKGIVAIVNHQKLVAVEVIQEAIDALADQSKLTFQLSESDMAKGGLTIELRDDGVAKPPMIAAPESGWAHVNVGALCTDIKSESGMKRFLPLRTQKMITRAFAYACGAGGSGYQENILDISCVRDLDYRENALPVDSLALALKHAEQRGVTPFEMCTYSLACSEGCARAHERCPAQDLERRPRDPEESHEDRIRSQEGSVRFLLRNGRNDPRWLPL